MTEPSTAVRTLHNLGLAAWFGGTLFGQVALNPTVSRISDKGERRRVLNESWARYNAVNTLAVISTVGAWKLGGLEEDAKLVPGGGGLVGLKNLLLGGALVNSVASAALGARIASQSSRGDTPVDSGTEPAPEKAARAQRLIGFFGSGSLAALAAAIALSAALEARAAAGATSRGVLSRLFS